VGFKTSGGICPSFASRSGGQRIFPDLAEGQKNEGAFGDAGVGELELGVFQGNFAEEEDIDVDDAGGVAGGVGFAAEGALDGLGFAEEFQGVAAGVVELDDSVEEAGGIRRAILRSGVVQ
jgi:hypothetical protein